MQEFAVCLVVAIASIIILKYIVNLFTKQIRNRMYDIVYNSIKVGCCYTYRQTKENTRPRYAAVDEKKIENGIKYIYYRSVNYNGYLSKYEADDLIINDNIDEFMRKYIINDNPIKLSDIEISANL